MGKIKIVCDLCGGTFNPDEVKAIHYNGEYSKALWIDEPRFDSDHFICFDCLFKLGWSYAAEDFQDENENNTEGDK